MSNSHPTGGCIFGDPKGFKVEVEGVLREQLAGVDCHADPNKLAAALLDLLFTKSDLSCGNATSPRRPDIVKLLTDKLNAIRG